MEQNDFDAVKRFLNDTGGKLIFEAVNRVTITRPAQAAKSTKDVETPAVIGVEVSCYGNTGAEAVDQAVSSYLSAVQKVDSAS